MLALILQGLIIGFAIAAPVGPIGVLCIQRSLHDGFKIGLMTGLGAALADGVYGLIVAFGLTTVSSLLMSYQFWIRLIGGLFLFYLAVKMFFAAIPDRAKENTERSSWHAIGTTFLLTLTNPATILSFLAVFAGLGLSTTSHSYGQAILLVASITIGSAIWWVLLSSFVSLILHHRLSSAAMRWINHLSGVIMLSFALYVLVGIGNG